MKHIPGIINPSDDLTKPLGWVLHARHVRRIMGHSAAISTLLHFLICSLTFYSLITLYGRPSLSAFSVLFMVNRRVGHRTDACIEFLDDIGLGFGSLPIWSMR